MVPQVWRRVWKDAHSTPARFAAGLKIRRGLGLLGLVRSDFIRLAHHGALVRSEPKLRAWLTEQGLDRGYAGYWDANVLRYRAGLAVSTLVQC